MRFPRHLGVQWVQGPTPVGISWVDVTGATDANAGKTEFVLVARAKDPAIAKEIVRRLNAIAAVERQTRRQVTPEIIIEEISRVKRIQRASRAR